MCVYSLRFKRQVLACQETGSRCKPTTARPLHVSSIARTEATELERKMNNIHNMNSGHDGSE